MFYSVIEISDSAFCESDQISHLSVCEGIRSITLPAGIERIGEYCFMRCDSLREVTILAPTPPAITNVFADTTGLRRTLFVPKGA